MRRKLIITVLMLLPFCLKAQKQEIDLSGKWGFQLDLMDFRRSGSLDFRYSHLLQDSINLPSITDDHKQGLKSTYRHIDRLTREYEYMGPAWYQRHITIPEEWKGKQIFLYMERTHWLSTIVIGNKEVSNIDYISVPHNHNLTQHLTPGKEQLLTICIDNRYQYPTHKWDHAHSEFTQINWNGILGEMKLIAVDPVYIADMQIYPNITDKTAKVKITINNSTGKEVSGLAKFKISGTNYQLETSDNISVSSDSIIHYEHTIQLGNKIKYWDEFNPNIYTIECELETNSSEAKYADNKSETFGMREVKQGKNHIQVNNQDVNLRGTVENGVFPLTGYAPVDDASWERVLGILKEYGMNHMRFHSWCPPKAAFRAADKLGVYFQVELPFWGADAINNHEGRFNFFRRELRAVLKEYGNHPSFILYCNGNEISGDFDYIEELTSTARGLDSRHLYSGSTARNRVPSDQYYVSHKTNKGRITVYQGEKGTDYDVNEASDVDVPVIAHEAGQRAMYPDFKEMDKYIGPVKPRNFEIFRERLDANGMLDQADNFFKASGALTVIEYKDVIEALLRSNKSGGFQLLSINDFPGQGYAFVGILDPFWNSKGLITAEKFREFCAPTTALLRFEKRVYFNSETFTGKAEIYNFSDSEIKNASPKWSIKTENGTLLNSGKLPKKTVAKGAVVEVGTFSVNLDKIRNPQKLIVELELNNKVKNSWEIWVYPNHEAEVQANNDVLFTTEYNAKAEQYLEAGKKVVLYAKPNKVEGRKSVFHNHFWNPIMFKWPPMTLGCLIDNNHPIFKNFPTENHTNWQWWDILENAKVIEMTDTPKELRPFIQPIDAQDNNQKLGIAFEAKVKKGKLLVIALDVKKKIEERPATLQLMQSISEYANSNEFNPKVEIDNSFIKSFLKK